MPQEPPSVGAGPALGTHRHPQQTTRGPETVLGRETENGSHESM